MNDAKEFDLVVARMASQPTAWTADDYNVAFAVIRRFVVSRFNVPPSEADEIVSDVMVKFFRMHVEGRIDPAQNPGSYLRRAAQWAALDHIRHDRRITSREIATPTSDLPSGHDDNIARALDESATADLIKSALARAREAGDTTVYLVIVTFLNASEAGADRPSNRNVARRLGISHTAVAHAMERFRVIFEAAAHDSFEG